MTRGKSAGAATKPRQKAKKANGSAEPEQQAANPPEPPSPGAGHNEPPAELSDDQRQALFFQHRREYQTAEDAKKKADADFKNVCKRIKSEGTSVRKIKLARQLETVEGEAAIKAEIAEMIEAVRWTGGGVQLAMFDEPDRTPAVDRAFEEGKRACMQNAPRKPPYEPSVPQYSKWLEGFSVGQDVLMQGFKPFPDTPLEQVIEEQTTEEA